WKIVLFGAHRPLLIAAIKLFKALCLPAAEAYRNMWLMGMAALGMVIVFTFLLFQKIRTADSAPAMASSK
ncbi:hypothetical protein QU870_27140, partial [Escherichia coli]|nr:hypothetical protein [Escherichia coli]